MSKHLEVLGYDTDINTIFVKGISGSVTLDIIPDAVCLLKSYPSVEKLYMQDYNEVEVLLTQDSTIESAVEDWIKAVDKYRGTSHRSTRVRSQSQYEEPACYL